MLYTDFVSELSVILQIINLGPEINTGRIAKIDDKDKNR